MKIYLALTQTLSSSIGQLGEVVEVEGLTCMLTKAFRRLIFNRRELPKIKVIFFPEFILFVLKNG